MPKTTTEIIQETEHRWKCKECKWTWVQEDTHPRFWKYCPNCSSRITSVLLCDPNVPGKYVRRDK